MAEELCRNAKDFRQHNEINGSCLDWHFALSGLYGGIETIRQREYQVGAGSLTLRPVTMDRLSGKEKHSWLVIENGVKAFQDLLPVPQSYEPRWAHRQNKLKALREALREGPKAVERFCIHFNKTGENPNGLLPEVEVSMTNWPSEGWQDELCGYFDAVELADWFIPLKEER
jgi:hypothetical protein